MSRIPELDADQLTDEQLRVYNDVLASRGSIAGPFRVWLHSPELADRTQHLGEFVRYKTVLDPRLSELAILIVARRRACQVEWSLHEPCALEGGLHPGIIDALRENRRPEFGAADEEAVYDFCTELLAEHFVGEATFRAAMGCVGRQGIVELTVLTGYYTLVSMTLNAFEVGLPPDVEPALPDCPTFE